MKKAIILFLTLILLSAGVYADNAGESSTEGGYPAEPVYLTDEAFREKIFNYAEADTWNYQGTLPAIVDFYADWCNPCKMLAPILDELASEYQDQIIIYKVDVDKEKELARAFGISSVPSLLFIPSDNTPGMVQQFLPKESLVELIHEHLLIE